jgi:vanadium-dependent haloperoxidase-like protein/uncharacterized protein DUF6851
MPLYMPVKAMTFAAVVLFVTSAAAEKTIVVDWNNVALTEVRASRLGPPIVARALAIAHTCMYDAWAQYDAQAVATTSLRGTLRQDTFTVADKKKAISFAAYRCLVNLFPAGAARLAAVMTGYGYTLDDITPPAHIGNAAAQAVIDYRTGDGSNQYSDLNPGADPYADYTGYTARNPPMAFCTPLMETCAPLDIPEPNHWQPLIGPTGVTQECIGAHWDLVVPFAIAPNQFDNMAPEPPDIHRNDGHYQKNVNDILQFSAQLDPERKLIVEYWADGPASELPPGHWGLFAQFVSERDHHSIDRDVKMFFAMHNASFDAGIVAWHLKRKYDSVRPITAIRYLNQGKTIRAWGGPGRPIEHIRGETWMPYNPGSNLTPAFQSYISGHSTFSSASATVLKLFTGSDYFRFSQVIPANFGRVELGIPAAPTTISFATFSEAAQQAGLSRLYGGIHFFDDNTIGQMLGALIGEQAWVKAQWYFNGAP